MSLEYYLALLQLHIAVVSVVIAGIVALVQLLNSTKPHRDVSLLVSGRSLYAYGGLLALLLVLLALGSWTSAFPASARDVFGGGIIRFYGDGTVGLVMIILALGTLAWFAFFAARTRMLLDVHLYLKSYVSHMPAIKVRNYLRAIYAAEDAAVIPFDPFQPIRELSLIHI